MRCSTTYNCRNHIGSFHYSNDTERPRFLSYTNLGFRQLHYNYQKALAMLAFDIIKEHAYASMKDECQHISIIENMIALLGIEIPNFSC